MLNILCSVQEKIDRAVKTLTVRDSSAAFLSLHLSLVQRAVAVTVVTVCHRLLSVVVRVVAVVISAITEAVVVSVSYSY